MGLSVTELKDGDTFCPSSLLPNTPFTQAAFYGNWQTSLGRKVRRFIVSDNSNVVAYFQMVKYPLVRGKNYLYLPYGPVIIDSSPDLLQYLKQELSRIAKTENAVFVRLDFTCHSNNDTAAAFFKKAPAYTYHSAYFQPRLEWVLNLDSAEDDILSQMHEKTRYSIRLAERRGIKVEIVSSNFLPYFERFYELMSETAERNEFSLHPKEYYKNIFDRMDQIPGSFLAVARYGDEVLAIDLIIVFGQTANYVFGGSSDNYRSYCPSYLAKWEAIKQAKRQGCRAFNFGGIATAKKLYKGWEGLTAFKKKFGGQEVAHSDFYDLVINPLWYHLYNLRKRLKAFRLREPAS